MADQYNIKKVPNQRIITVDKAKCDKQNLYMVNNLQALGEAARRLTSKGGFKLYIYMAQNQDKYRFALSSADFMQWSNLGNAAYKTAFEELVEHGYLIEQEEDIYIFYDKSQKPDTKEEIQIINNIEYIEEIKQAKKDFVF